MFNEHATETFNEVAFKVSTKPTWFKIGDLLIAKWQHPNTQLPIYTVATGSQAHGWKYEGN